MSLRIIAGVYGSRVLKSVRGLGTRPLLGQVKAAIFNILGDQVVDAVVWDQFAGTGATGIESLSRGAKQAVFVEKNNKALEILRGNLQMLGEDAVSRSVIARGDAWEPPAIGESQPAPNLIFLDPPYAMVEEDPVKSIYRARQLAHRLAPGGCLVFHFEAGVLEEDDFDDDLFVDLRQWGGSAIAFVWRQGEVPERVLRRRERDALRNGDAEQASAADEASDAANAVDAPRETDDAN
jgi:16S rRNA (guanine966-N2)-methyltransferase